MPYVFHSPGVDKLFISCAVGGINREYALGDLVIVADHIDFCSINPLIGLIA